MVVEYKANRRSSYHGILLIIISAYPSIVLALLSPASFYCKFTTSCTKSVMNQCQHSSYYYNVGTYSDRRRRTIPFFALASAVINDSYSFNNEDSSSIQQQSLSSQHANTIVRRRNFLIRGLTTSTATVLLYPRQSANAAIDTNTNKNNNNNSPPWNPLNLKGTFWETGKLYEKSLPPDYDNDDFIIILENTISSLHSSTLLESISEGQYSQTLRLLRGNLISESQIRLASNALIDLLPEDDESIYKCNESFRIFLRYFDVLDAEVDMASRPFSSSGGGGVEGMGMGGNNSDPRMEILTRVGEVEDALKIFVKNIKDGLGE